MGLACALLLGVIGLNARASVAAQDQAARAKKGEPVVLFIYAIKADKRAQFESVIKKIREANDQLKRTKPEYGRVARQTRELLPAKANADGTYTYVFLADPVVSGFEYSIADILREAFGQAESDKQVGLIADAEIHDRLQILELIQGDR